MTDSVLRGSGLRAGDEDWSAIVQAWLEAALDGYPPSVLTFLAREEDPFRNPLGHVLREHLPALADELLGAMRPERLAAALEPIVRIGAVQDVEVSRSVGFVFRLKPILRARWTGSEADLRTVEARIDDIALMAFDLFLKYRERIYAVKADEVRRRVAHLERVYLGAPPE